MKWLFTPATSLKEKVGNIFAAFGFNLLWVIFIKFFLNHLYGYPIFQIFPFAPPPHEAFMFFGACIYAPLTEEALFRYAPITLVKRWGQNAILPMIIFSSIVFGLAHGNGMYSVLVQGVGGFLLSLVYIKNNYSYVSSVISHSLWNISVIYLLHF